jgi:hypothetical protein
MSQTKTKRQPKAWEFAVHNEAGEQVATLTVHKGTGRWVERVNRDGEIIGRAYAWDAAITYHTGQQEELMVSEKALRAYRKAAHAALAAREAQEKAAQP